MVRRQRAATVRLIAVVVVVLAAAVYFLKINPIYNAVPKGLDLQGGLELLYQAAGTVDQPLTPLSLQQTVQVISYRVDQLGVASPIVQAEPPDRILVELAGVKDPTQAKSIISSTADLEFKDVSGNVIVTGSDLKSAAAEIESGQGNVVALTFNSAGQHKFAAYTAANQGKQMSIYLNGQLVESPTIRTGCCPSGNSILQGNFQTFQDAQTLAIELNSGALPLSLTALSNQTVSATLGADSVHKSELAGAVALALVVAFMFLVYRVPGFWADIALLVYALLLFAVLAGLKATLTLPGITGLILSIGMAVDSNVIIYERIREELRAARSLRTAVDEGFKHGLRAILDSNATTIIAAVVLYYLGSGLVRGFAVTVGIGVVISLLTAVVFTRYLLHWLVDAGSRPSWWFFAPRAQAGLGALGIHGPVLAPAGRAAAGPRGLLLGNLRRDWRPEYPVTGGAARGAGASPEDAAPPGTLATAMVEAPAAPPAPSAAAVPAAEGAAPPDAGRGDRRPGGPRRKRARRGGR